MDPSWAEVESLLDEFLELKSEEQWAALERLGQLAPALRAEVERLLRASARPPGFLDGAGIAYAARLLECGAESPVATGHRIGPYRIVGEAGRGGMGTVYVAERDEPYGQRVVSDVKDSILPYGDRAVQPHVAGLFDRQLLPVGGFLLLSLSFQQLCHLLRRGRSGLRLGAELRDGAGQL